MAGPWRARGSGKYFQKRAGPEGRGREWMWVRTTVRHVCGFSEMQRR